MDQTARDIVSSARVRAITRHPYFTSGLFALRPWESPGCGTLWVRGDGLLGYDPEAVKAWGPEETATILVHECMHILRQHHQRCGGRRPDLVNVAEDAELNDDILEAGWKFPSKNSKGEAIMPVTPQALGLPPRLTFEEYYEELLKRPPSKQPPKPNAQGVPGAGGMCGSGAGNEHPAEADAKGDPNAPAGQTPEEQEITRRQVAGAIQEYAKSKGRGTIPGGWQAWADAVLEPPKVPWQQVLAARLRATVAMAAGQMDYTRSRINRRDAAMRQIFGPRYPVLPAMRAPVPQVSVVLDTSGSMGCDRRMEDALGEIMGIVKAAGSPARVFACDADVQAVSRVARGVDIEKLNVGGGGTDMRPGIKAADKERCNVIVVLTDGEVGDGWPTVEDMPRSKLIAAVVTDEEVPEHITCVRVNIEDCKDKPARRRR